MNEDDLEMYTDRQSPLEWASIFGWKEKLQVPKDMFYMESEIRDA